MPVSVEFLFEHCCFKQNSSCFVGPVNGHEMFWTVLLTIMGFFCCIQLILVGDHCQLGPVVMCKKAAK